MPALSTNGAASATHGCVGDDPEPRSRRHLRGADARRSPPDRRPMLIDRPIGPRADRKLAVALAPRPPPSPGACAGVIGPRRPQVVSNQKQDCVKPVPRPRNTPIGADMRATVRHTTSPAHSTPLEP